MLGRSLFALVLVALCCPRTLPAEDRPADPGAEWDRSRNKDGRWNQTDVGPFLASVLPTPTGTIAKGLSIKLGDDTTIAYDLATMTPRAAWTGGFLKFDPEKFGIVKAPRIDGEVQWVDGGLAWGDAKVEYVGLQDEGVGRITLVAFVNGRHVMESPTLFENDGRRFLVRQFTIGPSDVPIVLHATPRTPGKQGKTWHVAKSGVEKAKIDNGTITIPPSPDNTALLVATDSREGVDMRLTDAVRQSLGWRPMRRSYDPRKPKSPRIWGEGVVTNCDIGPNDDPYVVDTIGVPFDNPWKSLMFLTGLDFLPDGTLAVCTLYGDVWLVKGIDDDLDEVTWHRFATGMHQPLGLKVVGGRVHVLGRDQITRLHDRDGNGEVDFYENVNNDGQTSTGGHDYAACLETDPAGNFYYIRAHEGVVRVSKDGSKSESIAKGFRNPVGLGVSPDGMITAAPQEGTWTPASGIFEVKENGWYGFGGPKTTPQRPLGYDPPICWMPRLQDNSSGSQVWAPKTGFGPLSGMMLHLSYGQCAMLAVPYERVGGAAQGATVRLPMFFDSGVMRGRFGPDGHLYVCGLRGWQTSAGKDGCLQRVRYTGKPAHLPVEYHVRPDGIELVFSNPLDPKSVGDPQNWAVEQWNYKYAKTYGSEDWLVSNPRKTGRDEVFLEDVTISDDGRRVHIVFEDPVEPVMQLGITYNVKAADGTSVKDVLYGTINVVPEK